VSGSPLFIGLDLGTTNIKAVVVEEGGRIVSSGSAPVAVQYGSDGAAEQDIEDIWQGTRKALLQAVTALNAADAAVGAPAAARVRAIGVSSQGGAIQVLDAQGTPVGRVIGWQDSRARKWNDEQTAERGSEWFARHTGYAQCASAIGQVLRLRAARTLPAGFRLAFVGDTVVGRLCGRRAHDATSLSEAALLNPATGAEDPEVLAIMGMAASQLPDRLAVGEPAGTLLAGVAGELGLPAGIPVGPAAHDQYAAATGCGAVRAGDTMMGAGTAWVLLAVTDTLSPPIAGVALVGRHPVEGLFGQMLSMVNGGSCLSWAVRTLGLGSPGIADLDALMAGVPPGSEGLRFRPLLSEIGGGGLPPGTAAALEGLRLGHTASHIVRALVEGLACELDRSLRMMAAGGVGVERLIMCGKAASSAVTPQVIADTTGLPVDCASLPETSSLGAAVFARHMVSAATPLAALADAMKPPMRRVIPGPGQAAARRLSHEYSAALARLSASARKRRQKEGS
jgi:xylulokinase